MQTLEQHLWGFYLTLWHVMMIGDIVKQPLTWGVSFAFLGNPLSRMRFLNSVRLLLRASILSWLFKSFHSRRLFFVQGCPTFISVVSGLPSAPKRTDHCFRAPNLGNITDLDGECHISSWAAGSGVVREAVKIFFFLIWIINKVMF